MMQSVASPSSRFNAESPLFAVVTSCAPSRRRSYAYCSASAGTSSTTSSLLIRLAEFLLRDSPFELFDTGISNRDVHDERRSQTGLRLGADATADVREQATDDSEAEASARRLGRVEV